MGRPNWHVAGESQAVAYSGISRTQVGVKRGMTRSSVASQDGEAAVPEVAPAGDEAGHVGDTRAAARRHRDRERLGRRQPPEAAQQHRLVRPIVACLAAEVPERLGSAEVGDASAEEAQLRPRAERFVPDVRNVAAAARRGRTTADPQPEARPDPQPRRGAGAVRELRVDRGDVTAAGAKSTRFFGVFRPARMRRALAFPRFFVFDFGGLPATPSALRWSATMRAGV